MQSLKKLFSRGFMNTSNLIPDPNRELEVLNFTVEKFQATGICDELEDLLYHHDSKAIFKRIKQGEDVRNDFKLPVALIEAFLSEGQYEATLKYLSDLQGRREALKEIEKNIFNFDVDYSSKNTALSFNDLKRLSLEQVINNPRGFYPDQWNDFYSVVGGFIAGEVIGIAGGSGSGKTTFAIELLTQLQNKYDCKTGFISCEMGPHALGKKIIKRQKQISSKEYIWTAHNKREAIDNFDFGNWEKCIFAHDIFTLKGIEEFVKKHRPSFFAIDYMGMIRKENGFSSGDWAVHLTNSIKEMCKKYGTVCFALFQLDKDSQKKDKNGIQKTPSLVDIYGGIGSKQALDSGLVVYKKDGKRFAYWEKVRDYYDYRFADSHFEMIGNAETGYIYAMEASNENL